MRPSVIVALLNWNGKKHLAEFLPSVVSHSGDARIVVIDNASTDDSVAFLKSNFPNVEIILNKSNSGYAGGYSEGLEKLDADYFILLNSDVEVTPNWIDPVVQHMESDKKVAAAQPLIRSYSSRTHFEYAGAAGGFLDKDHYPFCRGRMFETAEEDRNQYSSVREIFWATGACLFVRASAYREVGGLDPDFFAHMEEIDFCYRLKNRGYKILAVPPSIVFHLGGGTLNYDSPNKTYLNFRNNLFLIHKNYFGSYLFFKVFRRLSLDGLAGLKFLFSGKWKHFTAVIKAHFHYYGKLSLLGKKRSVNRNMRSTFNPAGMYRGSVILDYYLRGRKTFSALEEKKFL
ncbi:MAG TPA: glycosyltransferase family 2 protein [Flavobacteriales bacterium]|nr:glycosyltransferase family 2 protein [Flavobacteriales bacterium]HRJ37870.1 glycosyltransferase family 2 protein [Flavobacteriales bacterium]